MITRQPHREQSRAVLIGTGTFDRLRPIPAVVNNLNDLHQLLTGPGGALDPGHCRTVLNPADVAEVGALIEQAAEQATDTLIVYYTGHGLLDSRGRLHLALPNTDPDRVRFTALPITTVREAIADGAASTRVLILDCCFSGRAIEAQTDGLDAVIGQADITGTYTITSSARNETSYAPVGDRNTAFTAALIAAATRHPGLALDDLYLHTQQHLRRHAHPEPRRRADNNAGRLVLFPRTPPIPTAPTALHVSSEATTSESVVSSVTAFSQRIGRRRLLIGAAIAIPVTAGTAASLALNAFAPSTPSTSPTTSSADPRPQWPMTKSTVFAGPASVLSMAFSPDSTQLATGSMDGRVRLWNVGSREQVGQFTGHTEGVMSVAFSPDGAWLATSEGIAVRLWNVGSREQVGEFPDHTSWAQSVVFSPDGTQFAASSAKFNSDGATGEGTVRLWDVGRRTEIGQLRRTSAR